MNPRRAAGDWTRSLALGSLVLASLAIGPPQLHARAGASALVSAGDAAALLGGSPRQRPTQGGRACTWIGADGKHKLRVLTYRNRGVPPRVAYTGARRSAQAGARAKLRDEPGIGDRAFSGRMSFGVIFVALKRGRMIQVQYWTGAAGTARDVAALRPIALRAVTAFAD